METEQQQAAVIGKLHELRKQRGFVKRSVTGLIKNLNRLEDDPDAPGIKEEARRLQGRLENLDKDFRSAHCRVASLFNEDSEGIEKEHSELDRHDDQVAATFLRLQRLISGNDSRTSTSSQEKALSRKLARVERRLAETVEALAGVTEDNKDILPLLEQHKEQLDDVKRELSSIYEELIMIDLPDDHRLVTQHDQLEKVHFNGSHTAKRWIAFHTVSSITSSSVSTPTSTVDRHSKLPKLEVPCFDGNVLNWQRFWEQFETAVHSRDGLTNAEKLVYLQQAIRSGSARTAIEGLSHSGDQYGEAISCLQQRYDRPRLLHRAHVRTIMDTPPLRDGTGKELRRLHDMLQQHLRALKTMKYEPDPSFITSLVELKLDEGTLFEWHKHSQDTVSEVPHYKEILDFINLRAQASESLSSFGKKHHHLPSGKQQPQNHHNKVAAFNSVDNEPGTRSKCPVCISDRHPLYSCAKFKSLSHDEKVSVLKKNNLCMNCLNSGHFARQCKSSYRCKKCQKLHHTSLHRDVVDSAPPTPSNVVSANTTTRVVSSPAVKLKSSSLLMTSRVLVFAPDGSCVEARALLDNGSTSSFVSERLVQSLAIPRSLCSVSVSGIAGSIANSNVKSVASFQIASTYSNQDKIDLTAIVLPKVTCDLPVDPVPLDHSWTHLNDLPLADPAFGEPRRIDILLGVDVFVSILCNGRRSGPAGSPVAIETKFGWVVCGGSNSPLKVTSCHASVLGSDDILRKFWELEQAPTPSMSLTPEEKYVVEHFDSNHSRDESGRFVVPLPRKIDVKPIGESRSRALRRFISLERSLHQGKKFLEVDAIVTEYFTLGHAEPVPAEDLNLDTCKVFYLPMHVVYKASSSTTKIRPVFDASAKSSTGVSLNDTLLVGPTVHSSLLDVLLRFRMHRVALTADISKMYRAIELTPSDRDFHRFLWRSDQSQVIQDYRMTRVTFGVSASCFAANMSVKRNASELADRYPQAANAVSTSFYVDDCLTGADSIESAIALQRELQDMFTCGGFLLRKWNSNEPHVVEAIFPQLRELNEVHSISDSEQGYTKTLGLEWNTNADVFCITFADLSPIENLTKRKLVSDIAKVFDVLGWFAPSTIKVKILLQRVWELGIEWDEPVPETILSVWKVWRLQLSLLKQVSISRCYFPKDAAIVSYQVHGFCDASEEAYSGVV